MPEDKVHKWLRELAPGWMSLLVLGVCALVTFAWKGIQWLVQAFVRIFAPAYKLPFFKKFSANDYFHAFVLNGIVLAVSIAVTTVVNGYLWQHRSSDKIKAPPPVGAVSSSLLTIGSGYVSAFSAYYIMHIFTGFGKGMFASSPVSTVNGPQSVAYPRPSPVVPRWRRRRRE
jgi:hypothetical protein